MITPADGWGFVVSEVGFHGRIVAVCRADVKDCLISGRLWYVFMMDPHTYHILVSAGGTAGCGLIYGFQRLLERHLSGTIWAEPIELMLPRLLRRNSPAARQALLAAPSYPRQNQAAPSDDIPVLQAEPVLRLPRRFYRLR